MASEPTPANPPVHEPEQPREQPYRCRELLDIATIYLTDSDLWVFRRFTKLHLFNILLLQRRLSHLEGKLLQLKDDKWMANNSEDEHEVIMYKLTTEIRETLKAYGKAFLPFDCVCMQNSLTHLRAGRRSDILASAFPQPPQPPPQKGP